MRAIKIFVLTVIFYSFSVFLQFPILAKNCSEDVYYQGPYSVLFRPQDTQDDCSYPTDASPLDMNVIQNGRLTSELVDLQAQLMGEISKLIPNGDGTLNLTLEDISTFGIGGDLLHDSVNKDKLLKYRKVIEAYKNYDITHLYREAYADGIASYDDFEAWACERELCICNNDDCHLNPSIYSNASQLTPLKDQLQEMRDLAIEIQKCNNPLEPTYSDSHQCSNSYPINGDTSLSIANIVVERLDPNDLINSWAEFDDKLKFQTYSLHLTQSSPTFVLIVPQEVDCGSNILCLINQFFDPQKPGYIKAVIPETGNLKTGAITENNRLTPLKDQKPNSTASLPDSGGDLLTELMNQAEAIDPDCQLTPTSLSENLGASSTPVKNTSIISLLSNFFSSSSQEKATENKLYCVYVFSPPDLVDADTALGADDNSILRKLMPLKTTGFDESIDAPQNLDTTADGKTTNNRVCVPTGETIINADGNRVPEYRCDDNYVAYTGGATKSNQPAGKVPLNKKHLTFGIAEPLKSTNNIQNQSQCLVPWLAAGAQTTGFDLATAINSDAYNQSTCPNPIQPADFSDSQCSLPSDLTIKPECQLTCDTLYGYNIPPSLKASIESAASAFNIPPGLLLGAMYAEGGFEPRCSGDDSQYTEEEIQASLAICNSEATCCNNNEGPFSLLSAYQERAIFDAKQKAGLPVDQNNPGSACNIFDSALAVANTITGQRGYNAQFWYDTAMSVWDRLPPRLLVGAYEEVDSCGGIPYDGTPTFSCTGWSDSQVVTAIRLQQGFCGSGNQWMDIHRNQMLDVFHQCSN